MRRSGGNRSRLQNGTIIAALAAALVLLGTSNPAEATENGRNPFPNGLNASDIGNVPPKGLYLINEFVYITADRFNNGKGDKLFPNFNLDVYAYAPRFLWNSGFKILGGDAAIQVIQPFVYTSFNNKFVPPPGFPNPPPPGFQIPSPPFGSDNDFQLGDLFITPLLAWHRQNFHWAVGGDIVLPTGSWADKRLVNAGQNYLTLSPAVAFTYYPIEGLQFSAKLTVDINFENDDTNYDLGEAFLTDWSTTYTVPTSIGGVDVGLGGYTYNQFTKDTQNGHTVGDGPNLSGHDGFEGQAYGIGPIIGYRHPSGARVEVKYQKDFDVENRPEGSRFFIRAFVRF